MDGGHGGHIHQDQGGGGLGVDQHHKPCHDL